MPREILLEHGVYKRNCDTEAAHQRNKIADWNGWIYIYIFAVKNLH